MSTASTKRIRRWARVIVGVALAVGLTVPSATAAPAARPAATTEAYDTGTNGTIQVPTSSACPTLTSPPRYFDAWFNLEDMEVRGYYDPVNHDPWDYIKKVSQLICGAAADSEIKLSMYFLRAIGTLPNPGLGQAQEDWTQPNNTGSRPESDPEMIYDALEYVIKNRSVDVAFILDGGGITPSSAKRLILKRMVRIAGATGVTTESVTPFRTSAVEWCLRGCFNTGNSYQSRFAINHEKFLTISDTIWDQQGAVAPAAETPEVAPATAEPNEEEPQAIPPEDQPVESPATAATDAPQDPSTVAPDDPSTVAPDDPSTVATDDPSTMTPDESTPASEGSTEVPTAPADPPETESTAAAQAALLSYGAAAPAAVVPAADGAPTSRAGTARRPLVISTSGNFARSQTRNYVQEMTVVYGDYRLWQEFSRRYDAMAACSTVLGYLGQSTKTPKQVSNCKNTGFPVPLNSQLKKDSLGIWVDSAVRSGDSGRGTQVIFSPQPASVKDAYVKIFDRVDCSVDRQIRVAMFKLTDAKAAAMIKALNSLKRRGCDVKVLLTQQGGATTISSTVVKLLRKSKLNVKCTQTPMHTKVILIGPSYNNNGRVLSGTANMSTSGLRYSEEHTLIFDARAASPEFQDDIRRVYGVYRDAWYELSTISKSCKA